MRAARPPAPAALLSRFSSPIAPSRRLLSFHSAPAAAAICRSAPASAVARSISVSVEAPPRRLILLRHGGARRGGSLHERYEGKSKRWRPVFVLETSGSPSPDDQDVEDDSGFLGRTRLGKLIQAAGRKLLEKLNSARIKSPAKIFLVLLGFYTANALSTILGQTGDWDVLVAGIVVTGIEGIGRLMYSKAFARPPGRFQSFITLVNYWKAGVCLGLFVDAFKVGS